MSPSPGRIVANVPIPLPRPCDVVSSSFNDMRARLGGLLQHDISGEGASEP
ncbi:MAG: hypothetical protein WB697_08290 [Stellaceae bacterium]